MIGFWDWYEHVNRKSDFMEPFKEEEIEEYFIEGQDEDSFDGKGIPKLKELIDKFSYYLTDKNNGQNAYAIANGKIYTSGTKVAYFTEKDAKEIADRYNFELNKEKVSLDDLNVEGELGESLNAESDIRDSLSQIETEDADLLGHLITIYDEVESLMSEEDKNKIRNFIKEKDVSSISSLLSEIQNRESLEESKKKKEQGYFVKRNAGDVEKGNEFFNKNMGSEASGLAEDMETGYYKFELTLRSPTGTYTEVDYIPADEYRAMSEEDAYNYFQDFYMDRIIDMGPGEHVSTMNENKQIINIKESLNNYDKKYCSTDLVGMYSSCKLNQEDKKYIVENIVKNKYKDIEKFLYKKMK